MERNLRECQLKKKLKGREGSTRCMSCNRFFLQTEIKFGESLRKKSHSLNMDKEEEVAFNFKEEREAEKENMERDESKEEEQQQMDEEDDSNYLLRMDLSDISEADEEERKGE